MKRSYYLAASAFLAVFTLMASCIKPPSNEYTGPNNIRITSSDKTLSFGRKETIVITLQRSKVKAPQTVDIAVDNDPQGLLLVPEHVEFKGSDLTACFEVKINKMVAPTELLHPKLRLTLQPDGDTTSITLQVKKSRPLPQYTNEQNEIIEHWIKKGIPLDKILGQDLHVEVEVSWPNNGGIEQFREAGSQRYEGITVLVLSAAATMDSLVLKFHENALGMTPFFYFAHRKSTIENDEFWYGDYAGPLYAKVMKLINWNKTSNEVFECTLDSVAIGEKNTSGISVVNTMYDHCQDPLYDPDFDFNTPFFFLYTAWDRMKEKLAANDRDAIECHTSSMATPFPARCLNKADFHYSRDHKRQPPYVNQYDLISPMPIQSAYIDWNIGELIFDLYTDIDDAGGGYFEFKGSVRLLQKP